MFIFNLSKTFRKRIHSLLENIIFWTLFRCIKIPTFNTIDGKRAKRCDQYVTRKETTKNLLTHYSDIAIPVKHKDSCRLAMYV